MYFGVKMFFWNALTIKLMLSLKNNNYVFNGRFSNFVTKVIIEKSRGELSLVEQDIENVS